MFRETLYIAFHRLIEHFGFNTIQNSQVPVNYHLLAPYRKDALFYW